MKYYLSVPHNYKQHACTIYHDGKEFCFTSGTVYANEEPYDSFSSWIESCEKDYKGAYILFEIDKQTFDKILSNEDFDRRQYVYEKFNLPEFML